MKLKISKICLLLACLMYLSALFCGCARSRLDILGIHTTAVTPEMVLEYLNDRYTDDTFTFDDIYGGNMFGGNRKYAVSSQKFPDEDIHVNYTIDEDGKKHICDDYLCRKYKEQTAERISGFFKGIYGDDIFVKGNAYWMIDEDIQAVCEQLC